MVTPEIDILSIAVLRENEEEDNINLTRDMFVYPMFLYGCWWILYAIWLTLIGHKLPDRGWGRSSFIDFTKFVERNSKIRNRCA
jgi:hypothetical protein